MVYSPQPLKGRTYIIREAAAASLSRAETDLVRAEAHILHSPHVSAIKRALIRFEALTSMRLQGQRLDIMNMLRLEAALQVNPLYEANNRLMEKLIALEGLEPDAGFLEAFRYMRTIEWIALNIKPDSIILPRTVMSICSRCLFGPARIRERIDYRKTDYMLLSGEQTAGTYRPPAPEQIAGLIADYCDFVSKDIYTPAAQSAISHFQIESIKPFDGRLDGPERALSHMIFFRRGLLQSVVAPLALGPARETEAHARYIIPYQTGHPVENISDYINSGALFKLCAYYTAVAAESMNCFYEAITRLEARWREHLGKVEKGSTVDLLLHELPGMPLVTVNSAMKLVGRSFSATNDALNRFKKAGILTPIKPIQRNHAAVAWEAIKAFENIESRIIPRIPVDRDQLLSSS
jgi:hypothetical protein